LKKYDIIIIGSSFAGLAFANEISNQKLNILVIDKHNIITKTHPTTGILGPNSIRIMNIGEEYILNKINQFDIKISDSNYKFVLDKPRYLMIDIQKYLKDQYNKCINKKIKFNFNFAVKNITKNKSETTLTSFDNKSIKCKFLVIADGANSDSLKYLNIANNNKTLIGQEYIFESTTKILKIALKMDYDLAPGYVAWMTPHGGNIAIGTAGSKELFSKEMMQSTIKYFREKYNLKNLKKIEIKSGLIPIGGMQKNIIDTDYIVIGDAGGFCGPVLANGIYTAFYTGKVGAQIVGEYLKKNNKEILNKYINKTKYLKKHLFVRKLFNKVNNNQKFYFLSKIFDTPSGKKVLQQLMFKLPRDIKSMLKLILWLLSNLKNILYLIKIAT